jgi:hypothetical protein
MVYNDAAIIPETNNNLVSSTDASISDEGLNDVSLAAKNEIRENSLQNVTSSPSVIGNNSSKNQYGSGIMNGGINTANGKLRIELVISDEKFNELLLSKSA